ncbi:hypothetical protein D3C71_2220710 [compost metagenome]
MDGVDHVGHDAGVVRHDPQLLADLEPDWPVGDEAAVFLRELVDADVVAAEHVAVAGEAE